MAMQPGRRWHVTAVAASVLSLAAIALALRPDSPAATLTTPAIVPAPGTVAVVAEAAADATATVASEVNERRALLVGDDAEGEKSVEAKAKADLRHLIETSDLAPGVREGLYRDLDAADSALERIAVEARLRAALLD